MLAAGFIVLVFFYFFFNLILLYGWRKSRKFDRKGQLSTRVSIIIVVRNEEENLPHLLQDLEAQTYSKALYEIIIVDDHSEDGSLHRIQEFSRNSSVDLKVEALQVNVLSPKKAAIELGVRQATGSLILITDGDCRVPRQWVENMANVYEVSGARFIAGPVTFIDVGTITNTLMTIEFASLVGAGAAFLFFRKPVMCNAANLAFDRGTFHEVDGFKGNESSVSGDDVFLMRKIFERYPDKVIFNKDECALVCTYTERSWKKFFFQRVRWAGKWRKVIGAENRVVPVAIFIFHLLSLIAVLLFVTGKLAVWSFSAFFVVKFLGEYLFLRSVMKFLRHIPGVAYYIIASAVYPLYAVVMGVAANISAYSWKGRKYKKR